MAHPKDETTIAELEMKPYEENEVGLRGITYFGIGLLALTCTTSLLMWALLGVLESNAKDELTSDNPMMISEKERLPPEPRLQSAPGFGVDSENGRVNLELTVPQAEYIELKRQWDAALKNGQVDEKTGTVVTLPIEEAKTRFLEQPIKARSGPEAEKALEESRKIISDSSGGRLASETVR